MIRALLRYLVIFGFGWFIIFILQMFLITRLQLIIPYNARSVSLFFAISSFLICLGFHLASQSEKFKTQLGFLYLPTLFVKAILFFAFFNKNILNAESIDFTEGLPIFIPLVAFLFLEVYFIAKTLNQKTS